MTSMPKITMEWQRFDELSTAELYEMLRFRQSIFVVEQRSPYPDLDGLDRSAWHLLLRAEGEISGYLRLIARPGPPPLLSIGRVAVTPPLRRLGLGRKLINEALRFCRARYPGQALTLGAQLSLVRFYESFGFDAASEPYDDFGVMHIEMMRSPYP
jgi:ElaA protein